MEFWTQVWATYTANREQIIPLLAPLATFASGFLTVVVGSVVAYAALKQARIATRQAEIARDRHEEQIKADLQRRITESFTKAVEQLGHTESQIRVGGIYSLERISKESDRDYWPIMEILTAYVRERARWNGTTLAPSRTENTSQPSSPDPQPMADVAAAITVVGRRKPREDKPSEYLLDLRSTDLRGAFLSGGYFKNVILTEAHLEGTKLYKAHLEGASLIEAHLEGAYLDGAYLEGANLFEAHLEGAKLNKAHLEGAHLNWAHLERASLFEAHLEGAHFEGAHLEGANLSYANLDGANLEGASLIEAHLKGASLIRAHLKGAILTGANLEGASLIEAHLEGARLVRAHLEGANLIEAHLEGATFRGATGLTQDQIKETFGDARTERLPEGLIPPGRWSGSYSPS